MKRHLALLQIAWLVRLGVDLLLQIAWFVRLGVDLLAKGKSFPSSGMQGVDLLTSWLLREGFVINWTDLVLTFV
jgi:hypothetical protein